MKANGSHKWLWAFAGISVLLAGCAGQNIARVAISPANAVTDAMTALRQAAESPDAAVRSNAIEAMAQTSGAREGTVYLQALSDPSPMVQFAAAMAVGDTKYAPAREVLARMASKEGPDKRVYAGVLYALYRLGDNSHISDLARLLFHREPDVRSAAAMCMGRMGEPSAAGPIKQLLSQESDPKVELQAIESLAMLGDSFSRSLLEAYTRRPFLDERIVAVQAMARVQSDRAMIVLDDMISNKQPMAVRVAAAGAMAEMGSYPMSNYWLCVEAAERPQQLLKKEIGEAHEIAAAEVTLVQRLGVISLGWMNRQTAIDVLAPLLHGPDQSIRVAAAMSILRLLPAYIPTQPPAVTMRATAASTFVVPGAAPATMPAAGEEAAPVAKEIPVPLASMPAAKELPPASMPTAVAESVPAKTAVTPAATEPAVKLPAASQPHPVPVELPTNAPVTATPPVIEKSPASTPAAQPVAPIAPPTPAASQPAAFPVVQSQPSPAVNAVEPVSQPSLKADIPRPRLRTAGGKD